MAHFQLAALIGVALAPRLVRKKKKDSGLKVSTYEHSTRTNDQAALHYSVQTRRQDKATKGKTRYDKAMTRQ
jgi:hypothetical protein